MKVTMNKKAIGYNQQTALKYISVDKPIYCLSQDLSPQQSFKDGKPTGEIVAYKLWCSQEGLPPFEVKIPNRLDLPPYLTKITFVDLEACEIKNNVYFRAHSLAVSK